MPLDAAVNLGPGDVVLDEVTAPVFGPCLLSPNGWMDEDATWYRSRPWPGHILLVGDPAPPPAKWAP